jgi:hypothetical protein
VGGVHLKKGEKSSDKYKRILRYKSQGKKGVSRRHRILGKSTIGIILTPPETDDKKPRP